MEEEGEKHKEEEAKPSEDLPSLLPVPSSQHDSGSKDQVHTMSKFSIVLPCSLIKTRLANGCLK